MVPRNFRRASLQEVGLTQILGDHDFYFYFQHDKIHIRFQIRFQDRQTPPSSSLKPNPTLFFHQQHVQWSRNMAHSHFTQCLRVRDSLKRLSQHPWDGLWMRVKGPHHYTVTALGSRVKWPLSYHHHTPMIVIHAACLNKLGTR